MQDGQVNIEHEMGVVKNGGEVFRRGSVACAVVPLHVAPTEVHRAGCSKSDAKTNCCGSGARPSFEAYSRSSVARRPPAPAGINGTTDHGAPSRECQAIPLRRELGQAFGACRAARNGCRTAVCREALNMASCRPDAGPSWGPANEGFQIANNQTCILKSTTNTQAWCDKFAIAAKKESPRVWAQKKTPSLCWSAPG